MQKRFLLSRLVLLLATIMIVGCAQSDPDEDKWLFDLNTGYQKDLENGVVSETLKKTFSSNGFTLSEKAEVNPGEEAEWIIDDEDKQASYKVKKKEEGLKVYQYASLASIKQNRLSLDYRKEDGEKIFDQVDGLISKWMDAQKKEKYGVSSAVKRQLVELARGHFSLLVDGLQGKDRFKRTVAAAALGFSNDVRSIPYLLEALEDSDAWVAGNAAMGMGQIDFSRLNEDASKTVLRALTEAVLEKKKEDNVRGMASFALSQVVVKQQLPAIRQAALPYLLQALEDPLPSVRNHAIEGLGKIGEAECARAIIDKTLNDKHPGIRYSSVRALSEIGNDKGVDIVKPLVRKLRDPFPQVAGAAYYVLKFIAQKDLGPEPVKWEKWAGIEVVEPISPKKQNITKKDGKEQNVVSEESQKQDVSSEDNPTVEDTNREE